MAGVVDALREALGGDAVLTGADVTSRASGIWRRDGVQARAIVRPRNTQEVSRALAICHRHDQTVVAHGGLTGLVGSALTQPEDVVVSLERLNRIESVDVVDRTMTVQTGVVLQTLQETADAHGLLFPLDLGGRGSATIGGNISTNAGGNRVIRYGMTRDMVLGVEVVLADGTVVSSMNQMIKNNAGYDLKHLFIGSEGSLGIVTRAVLRLREKPRSQETVFVGIESFAQLTEFLKTMDSALGGTLSAFEVMWRDYYRLLTEPPAVHQPPIPRDYPYYVLVEAMGGDATKDHERIEAALADAYERGLIADAAIAQNQAQREQMWAMRDDVVQTFRFAPIFTFDVSMRISTMENYVAEVNRGLSARFPEYRHFTFGHMGDGNLHLVISVGPGGHAEREHVEEIVYGPLAAIGGSVSAEHGVGLEKKPYLHLCRSPEELSLMRTLKRALDPKGLLNRGKIFELAGGP